MSRVHVAIGSNIDPDRNVPWALQRLRENFDVVAVAPIYETAPIDRPEQAVYWNTMVLLDVQQAPEALASSLRAMESNAGRIRSADRYAARELDLDIMMWDGEPVDADTAAELAERPWHAWCLHQFGDGARPTAPEPPRIG